MRKGNGALDASRCQNDLTGPDVPEPLGQAAGRHFAGFSQALRQRDEIMLPIAGRRRAGEDATTGGANAGGCGFNPSGVQFLRVTDQ